jgi:hypothetical protein
MLDSENSMDSNHKRYMKEFGSSMAAYVVVVLASVWLLKHYVHSAWRFPLAVLPVIPAAFAMWAAIRYFRGLDELQRRIQSEGLAFSFLATCVIALSWGFLQNAGLPNFDVIWVAPLLVFLWGIGTCVAKRRYQ